MSNYKEIKKVLWAIDLFHNDEIQNRISKSVENFILKLNANVQPVSVLSVNLEQLVTEDSPDSLNSLMKPMERALEKKVKSINYQKFEKPFILVDESNSTSGSVNAFYDYALKSKADLIIVGTHGRSGLPRLFLGSFAESLLLISKIPVLVVNPKLVETGVYDKILFPTDLENLSTDIFDKIVLLAEQFNAELTILNVVLDRHTLPIEIEGYPVGPSEEMVAKNLIEEKEKRLKLAQPFIQRANSYEVKVNVLVEITRQHIEEVILNYAKDSKFNMIAMIAQSGPLTSVFIGSIARKVVRGATTPVWVLHD